VSFRAATAADAAALSAVFVAAGREAWGHFIGEEVWEAIEPPALEREGMLVAEDEEGITGFVRVTPCELDLIYTHPRVWGRGVGRALLDAGVEALRELGCTSATLWTEERNERPRRVYEAAGWRPDGEVREREWHGVPLRELRYRLQLAPA
jgi:GNAT superfamily N-acetyltransferase